MNVAARPSLVTHLKRALGWNLARVTLATSERERLEADGVTSSVVQRYAAWRRSLMLVAVLPLVLVAVVKVWDAVDEGLDFDEYTVVGLLLDVTSLVVMVALSVACLRGIAGWTRPSAGARLLGIGWLASLLIPVLWFLLPDHVLYAADAEARAMAGGDVDRIEALGVMFFNFVRYGGAALLLLPGLLSIIPGAVNGCLRVKSLLPAAQLPGWLLVCSSPLFLLFWIALLALANVALQSPLLVLGVCLWAGSPIWYALRGQVFVGSQLAPEDAARIGGVKRVVGLLALTGIGLLVWALVSAHVAGFTLVGFDEDTALSRRFEEWEEMEEFNLGRIEEDVETSDSIVYAFDHSSFQLIIDILAKLLLSTAVFAHLSMRATLSAWRHDRALRSREEASQFDADAGALEQALAPRTT
jgi:hypothetical protein